MADNNTEDQSYAGAQGLGSASSDFNTINFIISQVINKLATLQLVKVLAVQVPDNLDGTGTVDVQPMVSQVDGYNNATPHGTIYSLPYMRMQGGTNCIVINPVVGDIGLALFCMRDISIVKSTRDVANPGTARKYSWSDGLYIGGWLNKVPVQYIQFTDDGILILSPTAVTVNAPSAMIQVQTAEVNASSTVTVNASDSCTVTSPEVTVMSDNVSLGDTGGQPVARVGDSVDAFTLKIVTGSTKVTAA